MTTRIMIMAGGTGGHVFPALAVAEELRQRGVEVTWLGTRNGLEADVVPGAGFAIDWITIAGLRGKGVRHWLLAPFKLLLAELQALRAVLRRRPMAVLGMGGFASGPGGLATWLLRLPLLIHEQNAVAGLTNRLLARLASRCMEAFPGALPARCSALPTGNPVRREIAALAAPQQRFRGRDGALRLLVLGGSLGARTLNETVPQMLAALPQEVSVEVRHQAGRNNLDDTRNGYRQVALRTGLRVDVQAFIEDMAEAYAWADLVLCRAGALTVAELAAAGVAAILVPFPHAVDDHQTRNAAYLADHGAAILLPQPLLTPARLCAEILALVHAAPASCPGLAAAMEDYDALRRQCLCMACNARRLARPGATVEVADLCMEVAHG